MRQLVGSAALRGRAVGGPLGAGIGCRLRCCLRLPEVFSTPQHKPGDTGHWADTDFV